MSDSGPLFVTLGAMFMVGLAADAIGRRSALPRVTMLLVVGFIAGPSVLDLLPPNHVVLFAPVSQIALTMVGFLLGERLVHSFSSGGGRSVMVISLSSVLLTAAVLFGGLWACGVGVPAALLFAGIATATDPAATVDVVRQARAEGKFADTLLGVVAIDDAWGLLVFSLLMAGAEVALADGADGAAALLAAVGEGLWEVGLSLSIGGGLGVLMAFLTGRVGRLESTLLGALGFTFLACGLALWSGVSFILTAMAMGASLAALAKHHRMRPFHTIEKIELPFMIVFFFLAGSSLDLGALGAIGWIGLAYIGLRIVGRLLGGWAGAAWCGAPREVRRGMGLALMPQAGVALGMALLAQQRFPEIGPAILQVAIGSTVFFELTGPMLTRLVLAREVRAGAGGQEPP